MEHPDEIRDSNGAAARLSSSSDGPVRGLANVVEIRPARRAVDEIACIFDSRTCVGGSRTRYLRSYMNFKQNPLTVSAFPLHLLCQGLVTGAEQTLCVAHVGAGEEPGRQLTAGHPVFLRNR